KSLAHHTPDPLVRSALIQGLGDPDTGVVYETLQTITTLRANDDPTVAALLRLWRGSRSPWLRGTALKALAELKPAVARAEMEKVLAGAKHPAYRYAVVALGLLGEKGDVNQLVKILANPASPLLVKSAAIQGLM